MHEKTLLYSALGFTALAAIIGVYHAHAGSEPQRIDITPVSLIDASKNVARAEVPVRLTASDGTGLKLVGLRAEAAVEDPLALTELHLTFENPENRILEGTFRITLPQGASLSRFAMKVGNTWQEGEVVEKQAARQAYEDFLHRRQDPALMEQGAGNEFSARVFPIPARGTKEIIVTYAEAVELGAPYVLPLRGLPELGALDVNVHVSGSVAAAGKTDAVYGIHQQRFTPAADFVVEGKQLPRSPGLRSGDLAIARIVPFSQSRPEPVGSAIVLVDTSASRGLGLSEQVQAVKAVLSKLPKDARVVVAAFDQDVQPIFDGVAGEFGDKESAAIVGRGALGASDFEQALGWAGEQAKKSKATRLVFVTDGVATAGETDAQKLRNKVEALRGTGLTRIDAIAVGGIRDDGFLRTVTRGVLDRDGVVLDANLGAAAIARRLGEATSSGVPVKVDGARWAWPEKLDGLQAGDEVLVYAEVPSSAPVKIDLGGQHFSPDLRQIERPLVERAWAQAKIQSLIEAPKDSAAATKQEIIALSTSHRVVSPYTALLVLETDADYRRFNIDRNAKVDILAVQAGQVAVTESGRVRDDQGLTTPLIPNAKGGPGASPLRGRSAEPPRPSPAAAAPTVMASAASANAATAHDEDRAFATPAEVAPEPAPPPASAAAGDLRLGSGGGGASDGFARGDDNAPAPPPPPAAQPADPSSDTVLRQGLAEASGQAQAEHERAAAPARAARPSGVRRPPGPGQARCQPGDPLCANLDDVTPSPAHGHQGTTPPLGATIAVEPEASVRPGTLTIEQGISSDEVQGVIRASVPNLRTCLVAEARSHGATSGALRIAFVVDPSGAVKSASVTGPGSDDFRRCVENSAKRLRFTAPGSSSASFTQTFDVVSSTSGGEAQNGNVPRALPYEGRFKTVMEALARGDKDAALDEANRWHADQPGDVLSLVALGEVFEARSDAKQAARAYGSILELFSFRADSRRFAGERLERLQDPRAASLAIDTYAKAAEQRPDHPASHRLFAYALLKHGDYEKAFNAIKVGAMRSYPVGRFRGVDRILKEDMGLIAAAWIRAEPGRSAEIKAKLHEAGGTEEHGPSLRFVLVWETDANDVDFHIHDGKGGHAFYSQMQLPSGGELYADVTTGYGPECFTIRNPAARRAYPYTLQAHYYSRGPMGYGMGKLEIIDHDGNGKLSFDERPFVVMIDRAYVDMGKIDASTKLVAAK